MNFKKYQNHYYYINTFEREVQYYGLCTSKKKAPDIHKLFYAGDNFTTSSPL